jgi:antitoxin ChpS
MATTNLRKVGGSVMMVVPPTILERLRLRAGSTVEIETDGDRLIVEPQRKPRYTLEELLAQCDPSAPFSEEDRAWLDGMPVGRELL